jgi:type IV secretory pathway VirB2 component (pilin)
MAIGYFAYALWRFSEALFGRRDEPDEKKRVAKKIGSAANGLVYLFLAVASATYATGGSSQGQGSMTAKVLNAPGGQTIVVIAGLVIIVIGVALTVRGLKTDFEKHLRSGQMSRTTYRTVRRLGQVGYVARGIVFGLIGVFVIKAAKNHQPGQARGFYAALKSIPHAPFGEFLLIAAAVGLICFGAYCFAEARYRRL